MTLAAFLVACLSLLIAPGPTNTLMALAAAQGGMGRVLRLIPVELAAYLASILAIGWLFAPILISHPSIGSVVKLAAAVWVMILAVRLWAARSDTGSAGQIAARDIAVTTLLNPKALVFALVLLPLPGAEGHGVRLGLLALAIIGVALLWGGLGRTLAQARAPRLQRLAAMWLGVLSVVLATAVLRA